MNINKANRPKNIIGISFISIKPTDIRNLLKIQYYIVQYTSINYVEWAIIENKLIHNRHVLKAAYSDIWKYLWITYTAYISIIILPTRRCSQYWEINQI